MKFAAVFMLVLAAPFAAAFGPRGVAERSLYYLLYLGEEMLNEGDMRLATGCVGSRIVVNSVKNRCYLGEFLKWIEPSGSTVNLDKIGILGISNELGKIGGWGKQEDLANLAKTMSDPNSAIRIIQNAVDNPELLEFVRKNPPHEKNYNYKRWLKANPTWSPGNPVGDGITNPVVMHDKAGKPHHRAVAFSVNGPRPFKGQLNYPHLDGSNRGSTPAEFQEFFSTLSDNQQTIHKHVASLPDDDPRRAHGLKVLKFISTAMDHVIELREQDFWDKTIKEPRTVGNYDVNADADNPNMSDEEKAKRKALRSNVRFGMQKYFKDALVTKVLKGRWLQWQVPDREKTIKAAVAKHYFPSEADAAALYDAFFSELNPPAIEHRNMIISMEDVGDRFHGHENHQPTVC